MGKTTDITTMQLNGAEILTSLLLCSPLRSNYLHHSKLREKTTKLEAMVMSLGNSDSFIVTSEAYVINNRF